MKNKINHKQYKRRAQSTLEYAMVIACLAAALIGMQIYIKRSIQGKLRDAADEIGDQYSAKKTTSNLTQTISNAAPVTISSKPRFITVQVKDCPTCAPRTEKREIMETTRTENTTVNIGPSSYEETGKLSDENLFD